MSLPGSGFIPARGERVPGAGIPPADIRISAGQTDQITPPGSHAAAAEPPALVPPYRRRARRRPLPVLGASEDITEAKKRRAEESTGVAGSGDEVDRNPIAAVAEPGEAEPATAGRNENTPGSIRAPSPRDIIINYLGRKELRDTLLFEGGNTGAQKAIERLTPEDTAGLAQIIISGLGQERNTFWDIDKKDAGLALLSYIPLSKIEPSSLSDMYLKAVDMQGSDSDPLGSIDALLEAGKILAPGFPRAYGSRIDIEDAWRKVEAGLPSSEREVWQAVSGKVYDIKSRVVPPGPERERDVMERHEQEIRWIRFYSKIKVSQIAAILGIAAETVSKDLRVIKQHEDISVSKKMGRPRAPEVSHRMIRVAILWKEYNTQSHIAEILTADLGVRITLDMVNSDMVRLRKAGLNLEPGMGRRSPEKQQCMDMVSRLWENGFEKPEISAELSRLGQDISPEKITLYLKALKRQNKKIRKGGGGRRRTPDILLRRQRGYKMSEAGVPMSEIARKLGISELLARKDIYRYTELLVLQEDKEQEQ